MLWRARWLTLMSSASDDTICQAELCGQVRRWHSSVSAMRVQILFNIQIMFNIEFGRLKLSFSFGIGAVCKLVPVHGDKLSAVPMLINQHGTCLIIYSNCCILRVCVVRTVHFIARHQYCYLLVAYFAMCH